MRTPDELAPPTLAHRIEFAICWWIGTAFDIAAGWLLRRCFPSLCFHQPARSAEAGFFMPA